ncbi:DUF6286 domain-containing protein [Haloactinomyces albus]|uniref:DUF6286 domain-containing protein n=1 Tax=Haloactinomyces albus TaxID=1352928 RepID=A0AAE4CPL0_9ACTN|nr:DUF6286 domain-containing protein [Haloactinomyces albus]MDR7303192.1 hypothetical protein [Haloactinomyces albus]
MRALVRLITTLLGLALAAAGALLVLELAWAWLRPGPDYLLVPWPSIRTALRQLAWNDVPVRSTAAIVALVGIILLVLAGKAGRNDIRLHDPAPEVTVTTTPGSLARVVGHQVREQDGVATASVTATRGRIRVRATSEHTQAGELHDRLTELAEESVRNLPLRTTPKISVTVRPAKERR